MDDHKKAVAKACLDGAEDNTMTFRRSLEDWCGRDLKVTRSTSVALWRPTTCQMVTSSKCRRT